MTETYDGTQDLDEYVVKFYADWCGPCKVYAPLFDKLADEDSEKSYIAVNVDEHPDAIQKYQVRAVPTVVVEGDKLDDYMHWSQERLAAVSS